MPDCAVRKLHLLYETHARELEAFARQRIGGDEARDAVHDAYLRVLDYAGDAAIENPRAYLYRVTANVANDHGARAKQRTEWIESEAEPDDLHSPLPDPESATISRDSLRRCLAALEKLPDVYRHVFLLHRVDGVGQGDIAAALGIPKRTVERYIAKTLAHCLARVQG